MLLDPGAELAVYVQRGGKRVIRQVVGASTAPGRRAPHAGASPPAGSAAGTSATGRQQPAHGRFRLLLRPGYYLVSVPASADPPELVTVRPGEKVTVNFPDPCH